MKYFFCSLGLLAGFISPAAAQQGPAGRPSGAAQAGQLVSYRSATPSSRLGGTAQAAYYGQPHRAPQVRAAAAGQLTPSFGLKAGFNLSSILGASASTTGFDYENRASFNAGVMADLPFSRLLSFHPELLYSQKGSKFSVDAEDSGLPISLTGSQRLHYLDLPLLLRLKTNGFFVEAGPQLGYLLGAKQEATLAVPGLGALGSYNGTDLDGYRRLDVGYVVGVGYQLPQGLEFGLRYNNGFSNLHNPSDGPKLRNSLFQAQVGYLFGR